jgi:hypothetical protein
MAALVSATRPQRQFQHHCPTMERATIALAGRNRTVQRTRASDKIS